jgi:uncharacterized protein (TIRG00374 family)
VTSATRAAMKWGARTSRPATVPRVETVDGRTADDVAQRRPFAGRLVLLVAMAICLYVFAPSLAEVFEAWDHLGEVHPAALVAVMACEVASFVCQWQLQRIALGTKQWFSVATTQLAGNAFNRITPGGGATGTALQARMLADAGFRTTAAASALTVQSLMGTAVVVALPILVLPAIVFAGLSVPGNLADGVWIGAGVFVLAAGLGAMFLGTRRPVCQLGNLIERVVNALRRRGPRMEGLGERLLTERDEIRRTMGSRWLAALGAAIGRWGFEYFALLVTLYAVGASPDPWLVLIAFVVASVLSMIPLTPGGLGFVEAGLTGTLAVAGVNGAEALLATLVFRMVSFWGPMPVGAVAAVLFRRRYPRGSGAQASQPQYSTGG